METQKEQDTEVLADSDRGYKKYTIVILGCVVAIAIVFVFYMLAQRSTLIGQLMQGESKADLVERQPNLAEGVQINKEVSDDILSQTSLAGLVVLATKDSANHGRVLTVNADVVDIEKLEDINFATGGEQELPTVQKTYEIFIPQDVTCVNCVYDDLWAGIFIRTVLTESIYSENERVAKEIEIITL